MPEHQHRTFPLRQLLLALMGLLYVSAGLAHEGDTTIEVWDYHTMPPFLTDDGNGLSKQFVRLLDERLGASRQLHYVGTSRARVNRHVELADRGLLIWANPQWFPQIDGSERHHWTPAVLAGGSDLLSSRKLAFDYRGPASLYGKRLGIIKLWRVRPLEPAIAAGRIIRIDAAEMHHNLARLLAGRVDVALMPSLSARYLLHSWELAEEIHVSDRPLYRFERSVLASGFNDEPGFLADLDRAVGEVKRSAAWQASVADYRLPGLQ